MAFLLSFVVAVFIFLLTSLACFVIKRQLIFSKYINGCGLPYLPVDSYITGSFYSIVKSTISVAEGIHEKFCKEFVNTKTWFGFAGAVPFILTTDLDLIYHVWVKESHKHINRPYVSTPTEHIDVSLLQARDDVWRRTRRAIGSTMTPAKLQAANVGRDVNDCLEKLMRNLAKKFERKCAANNETTIVVDCSNIFKHFVMDTFLNIGFNQPNQIDYELDESDIVINAKDACTKSVSPIVAYTFFLRELTPVIQTVVKVFRLNGFIRCLCDMLNNIINSSSSDGSMEVDKFKRKMIHSLMDLYKEKKLTKDELMSNTYFLLLAAWDTTSDSLTALMWELAMNTHIQDKLRDEIIKDGIDSSYLTWSIKESLRCHPPASTAREIGEDFEWKGSTLMKGMALIMFTYTLMKDKNVWGDDVDQFRPERFDEMEMKQKQQHPAQYLVFGLGPRNCVGYHLAMLEMKLTICRLLMSYKVTPCSSTPKTLKLKEGKGTLFYVNMLRDPILLQFEPLHQGEKGIQDHHF